MLCSSSFLDNYEPALGRQVSWRCPKTNVPTVCRHAPDGANLTVDTPCGRSLGAVLATPVREAVAHGVVRAGQRHAGQERDGGQEEGCGGAWCAHGRRSLCLLDGYEISYRKLTMSCTASHAGGRSAPCLQLRPRSCCPRRRPSWPAPRRTGARWWPGGGLWRGMVRSRQEELVFTGRI